MMNISGKTKVIALIGYPIEHTMSPAMHNAAFREMGIDCVYVAFGVKSEGLEKAIAGLRGLNMPGMNVTIPHKVNVIPLLDRLDPLAEKIGAVNTIVNDNGTLTGYNTDATGFLQPLLENGFNPDGKNIVVVGAGGAARAVTYSLADKGAGLAIVNRAEEIDWAEKLAEQLSGDFGREVKALELTKENLAGALEKADMLVNATLLGMIPDAGTTAVPAELIRPGMIVYDVVYNPLKTRLIQEAEAAGAVTYSGIDMLVWQGVMASEKWTGKKPPFDLMKAEAVKFL
jgi:shikimate dehydrogenase